ncbi:MAG: hypothetical protein FWC27_10655 [Firmicutes bacterium]|nr:hypothetical protein [Bacillota bacterium]
MYYYYPQPQITSHPYQKLGGLPKFFVVMAPLTLFFAVISQFYPGSFWRVWRGYETAEFWLQLAMQLCQVYSTIINIVWVVMLLRRDPRFVRTWQLGYIGSAVSAAARWTLHLLCGYPNGTSLATDIIITAGILLSLFLWTLYYANSVRVRTYMGTDKYLRLAFFTRKAQGPAPLAPDGM